MSPSNKKTDYVKVLAAIGNFATKQGLDDVCVMEFEDGMILTGSTIVEVGDILNRHNVTHIFSTQDLQKMLKGG
jgi:hypothetical protein